MRILIWVYLILLVIEGILRKWAVPAFSQELLFIRDPVVFVIYALCYRTSLIPKNALFYSLLVLGILSLITGFIVLPDSPLTVLYGFRSDFFQLPMIFVIPMVFNARDVRKVGLWVMMTAIPIAVLMALQYEAPATSILNRAADEGGQQIASALGHIRPAGPFSFIVGTITFYTMVVAFICDGLYIRKKYPLLLVFGALASTGVAIAVSGSRACILSCLMTLVVVIVTGLIHPQYKSSAIKLLFILVFAGVILMQIPVFQDGLTTTETRATQANDSEGGTGGVADQRILLDYIRPIQLLNNVPPLGQGLGFGTIVGAQLLYGRLAHSQYAISTQDDAERELARNVIESGPVLGFLFVIFRFCLAISVLWYGFQCARRGNLLPFFLAFVFALEFVDGFLGQTTILGFCVATGGLAIAAGINAPEDSSYVNRVDIPNIRNSVYN